MMPPVVRSEALAALGQNLESSADRFDEALAVLNAALVIVPMNNDCSQ